MPIRNAKRPTMITEGEIIGLTDKEKQVLEEAGIAGGNFEIPEITLIPTSMEPISGILTEEQLQIVKNNKIVNFKLPSTMYVICIRQEMTLGETHIYVFSSTTTAMYDNYQIIVMEAEKQYILSKLGVALDIGFGQSTISNTLYLEGDANEPIGSGIPLSTLKEKMGIHDTEKYTISEDADTLVITENW